MITLSGALALSGLLALTVAVALGTMLDPVDAKYAWWPFWVAVALTLAAIWTEMAVSQ